MACCVGGGLGARPGWGAGTLRVSVCRCCLNTVMGAFLSTADDMYYIVPPGHMQQLNYGIDPD